MQEHWDVIIVGARCAGATLATLLARRGLRVLLLEASDRGTNHPMSTHLVHAAGMDVLDRIGLGDRVRAVTPATARLRYALDSSELTSSSDPGREGYCVRRSTLDPWLQDTAESAGAELRCRTRVTELIREHGRVVGVVARGAHGSEKLYADLVVGADGTRSSIAQLTAAPEYLAAESTRAGYFAYYQAPARWTNAWDATLEHIGRDLRYVFRCDDDQVLLTYVGARDEVAAWGSAHREGFERVLQASPTTGPLAAGKKPLGAVIGLLRARFYYREPIGPGYALVGDAGHFKDFVTGLGMSDAFLDAERLARAILDGRPEAFQYYWRERDVATLPLHYDAIQQGHISFNEPFLRSVIGYAAHQPELRQRFTQVLDRKILPGDLVPTGPLLAVLALALRQRRFDVLRGFLQNARGKVADGRELAQRKTLLSKARTELELATPRAETRTDSVRAA